MSPDNGDTLPDLTLPASGGDTVRLSELRGKKLIVYFYPKDNTPGCSQEGQDFSALYKEFCNAGAEIVGVSPDSVKSHDNFATKFGLPFKLLSDTEKTACTAFDVMKEKSMYGRKYLGVERSTFLFDADGVLRRHWRGVKVKGHAAEVLKAVQQL